MLYLIPSWLGESSSTSIFSNEHKRIIQELKNYIVENEKSARKFLKFIFSEINQKELKISVFDKKSTLTNIYEVLALLKKGTNVGLLSDAGLPCIADPGNLIVRFCHKHSIRIIPLSGPSSIFMSLISSGLNGQSFSFHGYLPIEKNKLKKKIKQLEIKSKKNKSAQIFIETPFRNNQLLDNLLINLKYSTMLCIATNITLPSEFIETKSIKEWRELQINLHKKPTVFIIQSK